MHTHRKTPKTITYALIQRDFVQMMVNEFANLVLVVVQNYEIIANIQWNWKMFEKKSNCVFKEIIVFMQFLMPKAIEREKNKSIQLSILQFQRVQTHHKLNVYQKKSYS